jgi:hypothetical protein
MKHYLILLSFFALIFRVEAQQADYRDIYPDTWVATDNLGRTMPDISETGPVKTDQRRIVGIFYITWHAKSNTKGDGVYLGDVTKILTQDPNARLDAKNPLWKLSSFHWGEPEEGYFVSTDEYVIRKDMSMLADIGVDVLVMDVTNAVRYWEEWDALFSVMQQMRAEGNKVPQFCFWAFNGPVITVVQDLYERIYKNNKYRDLWFYWDGKPLLLYNGKPAFDANGGGVENPNPNYDADATTNPRNPHYGNPDYTHNIYKDYTAEVKEYFTLRTMWWGYYNWANERFIGTEDNWSFGYSMADSVIKALKPEELLSLHKGKREQAAVTPAQHPVTMTKLNMGVGKSWSRENGQPKLDKYDMPEATYVPWLGKTVQNPTGYGIYYQERWDDALATNPEFLYLNDWNEWTAGKYHPAEGSTFKWLGRDNSFHFVDQYNAEFNRTIQPMKGGYTDNFYMQTAQNIRRYKGVRPIPVNHGFNEITIDGSFADWTPVETEYRDTKGDVAHRDYKGYGGIQYTNLSGRNDILTAKVALDNDYLYFYAEADSALTSYTGENWMLLFIDADRNPSTGWHGYDFIINKKVNSDRKTAVMRYYPKNGKNPWKEVARIDYRYEGSKLELAIPRNILGLTAEKFTFDFKWSDNPADLNNIISLCVNGDAAPNRRFNYRFVWEW